jgi:hypothetical protein
MPWYQFRGKCFQDLCTLQIGKFLCNLYFNPFYPGDPKSGRCLCNF